MKYPKWLTISRIILGVVILVHVSIAIMIENGQGNTIGPGSWLMVCQALYYLPAVVALELIRLGYRFLWTDSALLKLSSVLLAVIVAVLTVAFYLQYHEIVQVPLLLLAMLMMESPWYWIVPLIAYGLDGLFLFISKLAKTGNNTST